MTLSRRQARGRTRATKCTAWASSSSRTAMSASRLPAASTSVSREASTPRTKFEPVRLVKTLRPCSRRSWTTILVVVVLPLVPETTMTPRGRRPRVRSRKPGSVRSMTRPGKAVPPLPPPRTRAARRAVRPRATVRRERMELLLAEEGRTDNAIGARVPIWALSVSIWPPTGRQSRAAGPVTDASRCSRGRPGSRGPGALSGRLTGGRRRAGRRPGPRRAGCGWSRPCRRRARRGRGGRPR